MARRKKGRGRTTQKGTTSTASKRSGAAAPEHCCDCGEVHPPDAPLSWAVSTGELLLGEAERILEPSSMEDLDDGEVWASAIQARFRALPGASRAEAEPAEVLRAAEERGGRPGAVLAAALAVYGPPAHRERAAALFQKLRAEGVEIPAWVDDLGRSVPVRAALVSDTWGDGATVMLDLERPDHEIRAAAVSVTPSLGLTIDGFQYGASIAEALRLAESEEHIVVSEVPLADAGALFEAVLNHSADIEEQYGCGVPDGADYQALVEHRFALLPEGGTPPIEVSRLVLEVRDKAAVLAEWRRRYVELVTAGGITDADSAPQLDETVEELTDDLLGFVALLDGDPFRWSPTRISSFVSGFLTDTLPLSDEKLARLPELLTAWLRWSAEKKQLPASALALNLEAAASEIAGYGSGSPLSAAGG